MHAPNLRVIEGKLPENPNMELETLFHNHSDRVFRTAYRITGNVTDSEDVLQTVFLRLSRRAGLINLEPNTAAYLKRAAINASLDLLRSRNRIERIPIDDLGDVLTDEKALDPESIRSDRELRNVIIHAVSKLGQRSAEMFVLKYFEGLDNKEIALILETSHLVVGVMLHRARTKVKKDVSDYIKGGIKQ